MVDEEYRNWNAMISNEQELIEHFSLQGTPPLFLCILWKMVLETDRLNPVALKVIERIGPKGISANLRKLCDYVVCEFANAGTYLSFHTHSDMLIIFYTLTCESKTL